jgi:hypothetical protein
MLTGVIYIDVTDVCSEKRSLSRLCLDITVDITCLLDLVDVIKMHQVLNAPPQESFLPSGIDNKTS